MSSNIEGKEMTTTVTTNNIENNSIIVQELNSNNVVLKEVVIERHHLLQSAPSKRKISEISTSNNNNNVNDANEMPNLVIKSEFSPTSTNNINNPTLNGSHNIDFVNGNNLNQSLDEINNLELSPPTKKQQKDVKDENSYSSDESSNSSNGKKTKKEKANKKRLVWTQQLHQLFLNALEKLAESAVPKKILQEMNVEGLSRENVASHLQKYRLHQKKKLEAANGMNKMSSESSSSKNSESNLPSKNSSPQSTFTPVDYPQQPIKIQLQTNNPTNSVHRTEILHLQRKALPIVIAKNPTANVHFVSIDFQQQPGTTAPQQQTQQQQQTPIQTQAARYNLQSPVNYRNPFFGGASPTFRKSSENLFRCSPTMRMSPNPFNYPNNPQFYSASPNPYSSLPELESNFGIEDFFQN